MTMKNKAILAALAAQFVLDGLERSLPGLAG